jgi:hypothetical protein
MHCLCDLQGRPPAQLADNRSGFDLSPLARRLPPILLRSESIFKYLAGCFARGLGEREWCNKEVEGSAKN